MSARGTGVRLPPIEDRHHDRRREQRQPEDPPHVGHRAPLARANPPSSCTPVSSIRLHRNARANALTIALSTRGRGAHDAPSGVTRRMPSTRRARCGGVTTFVHPRAEQRSASFIAFELTDY